MKAVKNTELKKPDKRVADRDLLKEIEDMQFFMYALIHDLKAPISNLNAIFSLIKDDTITDKPTLMEKAETVVHNMYHTIEKLNKLLVFKDGAGEDIKVLNFVKLNLLSMLKRDATSG